MRWAGCFPQFPAAPRWVRKGAGWMEHELCRQVREDGGHFEQSSYYHVYALDMFLFHAALTGTVAPELARMAEYLAALLGPRGSLPLVGDDDGGRLFHPYGARDGFGRATLATCGVLSAARNGSGMPEISMSRRRGGSVRDASKLDLQSRVRSCSRPPASRS